MEVTPIINIQSTNPTTHMTKTFTRLALAATLIAGTFAASASELPADINLNPAPGTTMESISDFTITSGWLEMKLGVTSTTILINGKSYTAQISQPNYDALKFTLDNPVTASGTYNLIISEDVFLMGWDGASNPVIDFTYIVKNESGGDEPGGDEVQNVVPEGYTFLPAAGTEIPVLTTFSVKAESEMFLTSASRRSEITINGQRVDAVSSTSGYLHNILTWTLAEPINTPGYYTIHIPEGTFYGYNEIDNRHFIVTLIVTGGDLPTPDYFSGEVTSDPLPGSSVTAIEKIAIQYPKLTSAYLGPKADAIEVSNENGIIEAAYTLTPDEDTFNEAHVIWLEFNDPITTEGTYTLSFPACCFEIAKYPGNWYSAPFTLSFTVSENSAISGIDADTEATPAEYFTIGGIRIDRPSVPGIYLRRTGTCTDKILIR